MTKNIKIFTLSVSNNNNYINMLNNNNFMFDGLEISEPHFSVIEKTADRIKLAQSVWGKLNDSQRKQILNTRCFDPDIFYQITGINVKQEEPTFLEDEEIIQFEKDLKKLRKTALTNSLDL